MDHFVHNYLWFEICTFPIISFSTTDILEDVKIMCDPLFSVALLKATLVLLPERGQHYCLPAMAFQMIFFSPVTSRYFPIFLNGKIISIDFFMFVSLNSACSTFSSLKSLLDFLSFVYHLLGKENCAVLWRKWKIFWFLLWFPFLFSVACYSQLFGVLLLASSLSIRFK